MSALAPHDSIEGKYRLLRVLGAGGMGQVYEAEDVRLGRRVAIKVPTGELSTSGRRRFISEARAAAKIESPHSVKVLDVGELPDGVPYVVMEYLEGCSLADALDRGEVTMQALYRVIAEVLDALAAAHALGIVHRDIKPPNIFLHTTATGTVARVVDFGICKVLSESPAHDTVNSGVLGTPQFMAPEQLGGHEVSTPADIYALGVVLYYGLTSALPYDTSRYLADVVAGKVIPIETRRPDLPPTVIQTVHRMLARSPLGRPTATELRETFATLAGRDAEISESTHVITTIDEGDPTQLTSPGRAPRPRLGKHVVLAGALLASVAAFGLVALRGERVAAPVKPATPDATPHVPAQAPLVLSPPAPPPTATGAPPSQPSARSSASPTVRSEARATTAPKGSATIPAPPSPTAREPWFL